MKETFGQRFARLRKEKGLTQSEIAQKVNVSDQAVSKWETGVNMPDISLLLTIADILGVSTDYLLGKEMEVTTFVTGKEKKDVDKMMFKIIVDSKEGDKVRCNFPMALVKICIDAGMSAPNISVNSNINSTINNLDWKQLYSMVEQGLMGELITVESAEGDIVRILVE